MARRTTKNSTTFRSNFEAKVAESLDRQGIVWTYESEQWEYEYDIRKAKCAECGSTEVRQIRTYTPDFILPDLGIVLEVKGKFTSKDRTKHLAIQETYPDTDLRFVFQRDNWLTSKKKKTYTEWCDDNGFESYVGEFINED